LSKENTTGQRDTQVQLSLGQRMAMECTYRRFVWGERRTGIWCVVGFGFGFRGRDTLLHIRMVRIGRLIRQACSVVFGQCSSFCIHRV
jgi:hypothetical protein